MALVLRPRERTVEAGQRREDTKEAHGPSSHKALRLVIGDGVHQPEQVAHDENDAKGKVGGAKPALVEETTTRETRAKAVAANVGEEALPAGQNIGRGFSVLELIVPLGRVDKVGVGGSDVGGQELDVLLFELVHPRIRPVVENVLVVAARVHKVAATGFGLGEVVEIAISVIILVADIGEL